MTQMTQETQTDLGNTETKSASNLSLRSRKWCFTVNNYTEEEYDTITQALLGSKYVIGKEVGANGTPHLQGYVEWNNPMSFSSMKKKLPRAHIEKAKGNRDQNIKYCSKENNVATNIEVVKTAEDEYNDFMKEEYKDIIWKPWQQEVINTLEEKPSRRQVIWYWEETGNVGKSFLCQYIDWKYNAIIANGKQADVFNQYKLFLETEKKQPKVAIIDIPRSHKEYICYSTFEKIKDGLFYSGKYEGGKLRLIPHHLIIFANFEPDRSKLSEDRWKITHID